MVRHSDVDRYARAANAISDEAVKDLNRVLDLVAKLPPEEAITELQAILPDLVDYHGETLAAVAAEWYEQLRDAEGLFTATLADTYPAEQIQGTVKYAGKFIAEGNHEAARQLLAGAMQRWIMYSGRETVARNVRLDPSKPRFARVPVGETCAWCDMLASRGWVYHSKETAGINGGYHDRCNCQIVPSWDAGRVHLEGYDPDDLYDKYMAARQELEAEGVRSPSDKEIAARMQKLFPERYAPKPAVADPQELPESAFVPATEAFAFKKDPTLTEAQKDALWIWTTHEHREIADHLRHGAPISEELAEHLAELDSAMKARVLPSHMTLKRREVDISWMGITDPADVGDIIDKEYELASFTSTAPPGHRLPDGFGPHEVTILAPQGTHAIPIASYSQFSEDEQEILLNRGLQVRVESARYDAEAKAARIVVRVLEG